MQTAEHYELPAPIAAFAGQINDMDAHEAVPLNLWSEIFGPTVNDFANAILQSNLPGRALIAADDAEINAKNVWTLKRSLAPGSFDFERRLKVLDFTGVHRQIMFPGNMGLLAAAFWATCDDPKIFKSITGDRKGYARKVMEAYNEWCINVYSKTDRLRPVVIMLGDTPEALIADANRLIGKGVRAFWMPSSKLPGGVSPASPALDPFWARIQESNSTVLTHVGAEEGFLASLEWRKAPAFDGWKAGDEFSLDPWTLTSMHLPSQNFLTCMVLGGVFERFPDLRYGAAEVGAHWIGPLAENMDLWHANSRKFSQIGGSSPLRMKPSEYVRRNVRVAGFDIEDVGRYIDRYGLEEVYCYASDFPHQEGGKTPMEDFTRSLSHLGPDVLRKFFVENGKLLLPA